MGGAANCADTLLGLNLNVIHTLVWAYPRMIGSLLTDLAERVFWSGRRCDAAAPLCRYRGSYSG